MSRKAVLFKRKLRQVGVAKVEALIPNRAVVGRGTYLQGVPNAFARSHGIRNPGATCSLPMGVDKADSLRRLAASVRG